MLHLFAGVFVFVLVLVGNFTLPLKYKVQMSGKTEVNYEFFPSAHFERDSAQQSNFRGNIRCTVTQRPLTLLKMGAKQ